VRWQQFRRWVLAPAGLGLIAVTILAGLSGCATTPASPPYITTGDAVADGLAMLERCPPRDRVLWQYRTALAALRQGQYDQAKILLDAALERLEGIYGPDPEARKSRRLFQAEARKTFLGEPYERTMAYTYRGILYWMDGEPDNARACFLSAQFMDSDAEDQAYANDYALLEYLDGFALTRLGGDGEDALARARSVARLTQPPDYPVDSNVLIFADTGRGPLKFATGEYQQELRFRPGKSRSSQVRVRAGDQTLRLEPWDDLTFQATTRGGRVMDHVLGNKAVFKRATDTFGDVAIIGGAVMASQRGRGSAVDEVGAGLMLAGVLSKILAAATTPAADTRSWDNLPQYLYFGAMTLSAGEHRLVVEFVDGQGRVFPDATRKLDITVAGAGRDTVLFFSDPNS
jgi:tetratricopeptide (TPR) repeat protein